MLAVVGERIQKEKEKTRTRNKHEKKEETKNEKGEIMFL